MHYGAKKDANHIEIVAVLQRLGIAGNRHFPVPQQVVDVPHPDQGAKEVPFRGGKVAAFPEGFQGLGIGASVEKEQSQLEPDMGRLDGRRFGILE